MRNVSNAIKGVFRSIPDCGLKRLSITLFSWWMAAVYLPVHTWLFYHVLHRRVDRRHAKVVDRLREKNLITVVFLVKENAKWGWDSLYAAFESDPLFKPSVAVTFFGLAKKPDALQTKSFEENYTFFQRRGMRVVKAYDEEADAFIDLRTFGADIVFFQPPWHLPKVHDVPEVSKYALTCYVPYGINIANNTAHWHILFLQIVWRQFVEGEAFRSYLASHGVNRGNNLVVSGHPKLDAYVSNDHPCGQHLWSTSREESPHVKRIIYAPHWSFNFLRFATFDWSGEFLLAYARQHPETDWLFKPHPRLRYVLATE